MAGEMDSVSDSASLKLHVMVISGGAHGKSREVGLSNSFSIFLSRWNLGEINWKESSCALGGGEPADQKGGILCVGDGVSMVNVGMTSGAMGAGTTSDSDTSMLGI